LRPACWGARCSSARRSSWRCLTWGGEGFFCVIWRGWGRGGPLMCSGGGAGFGVRGFPVGPRGLGSSAPQPRRASSQAALCETLLIAPPEPQTVRARYRGPEHPNPPQARDREFKELLGAVVDTAPWDAARAAAAAALKQEAAGLAMCSGEARHIEVGDGGPSLGRARPRKLCLTLARERAPALTSAHAARANAGKHARKKSHTCTSTHARSHAHKPLYPNVSRQHPSLSPKGRARVLGPPAQGSPPRRGGVGGGAPARPGAAPCPPRIWGASRGRFPPTLSPFSSDLAPQTHAAYPRRDFPRPAPSRPTRSTS
jgi:hypothetical protein